MMKQARPAYTCRAGFAWLLSIEGWLNMRVYRIGRPIGYVAGLLLTLTTSSQASADFVPLGSLPDLPLTIPFGVSADGLVAVGESLSGAGGSFPPSQAFRWTEAGGMVGLGHLPGPTRQVFSVAAALSADGSVVVGASSSGRADSLSAEAYRWTQAGGMVGLGFIPGGFFNHSAAAGVSADGSVVVGTSTSPLGPQAFRWTQTGGMIGLGDLPGGIFRSLATGVSADGSVVVGSSSSDRTLDFDGEAFRWTAAGGMVGLGILGAHPIGTFFSEALAVSADGLVVVGRSSSALSTSEAFRWTERDGMVSLGSLSIFASAVSSDGSIVAGVSDSPSGLAAFIWDSTNGMRNLRDLLVSQGDDVSGWTLLEVSGISADGRTVVGNGINPSGQQEAFLARLNGSAVIPEPGSLTLLGLGALGLAGYYYRHRRRRGQ